MHADSNLPPTPRALSDVELQEVLERAKAENAGVLVQMQILEAQAQLRETDKSELAAWKARQSELVSEELLDVIDVKDSSSQVLGKAVMPEHDAEQEATAFDEKAKQLEVLPAAEPAVESVKSASQFWVWLTITGSLLPFAAAYWLKSLALTMLQSIFSVLLGVLVSACILAVGAIAGKRSSLPTMLLSRAAFGVFGNIAPSVLLVISRLFWTLALVLSGYLLIYQDSFSGSNLVSGSSNGLLALVLLTITVLAVILANTGPKSFFWIQRISGSIGLLTTITLFCFKASSGISTSERYGQGSWLRALGAAVILFAVFGLAWSSASADYASALKHSVRGWKVAAWSFLALAIVPSSIAIAGIVLLDNSQSSNSGFLREFAGDSASLNGLGVTSLAISLLTTLAMALKSSSLSFESFGFRVRPRLAIIATAVGALVLAFLGLQYFGPIGVWSILQGYSLVIGVPVAAWSGIFVSDVLIRRIAYHEVSLSRSYGFYKRVNWVNVSGWAFSVLIGYGLLKSDLKEFQWLGYFSNFASNSEFWRQGNLGLVIAFACSLLFPVLFGIPRIKKQEAEVLKIEARRNDLKDVLGVLD